MRSGPVPARTLGLFALLGLPTLLAAQPAPGLVIRDDREAREMVVEVGPVDLPKGGGHRQLPAFHGAIPVEGWLHGYRVELVDTRGREVPRRTLHHVNVIAPDRRELFSQIMLRVAAAGQETGPNMLPRMLGYRVRRDQPLIVTAMFENPTGSDLQGVRLRLHFPYTPADAFLKPTSILPFYMDVMPPASLHSYDLPAGRSSKSWEARPAVGGRIIAVGGHLHQYGTALRLEDVTARKVIWDGKPILDGTGEVVGMPLKRFLWRLGVRVRPGHVYRLTAFYHNPTGRAIPSGGMGALGGVFLPEDEETWPRYDRAHPEARLDWHLVHTGNQEMDGRPGGGHGHGAHGAPAAAAAAGHAHGAAAAPKAAKPAHAHGGGASHR